MAEMPPPKPKGDMAQCPHKNQRGTWPNAPPKLKGGDIAQCPQRKQITLLVTQEDWFSLNLVVFPEKFILFY